MRQVELILRHLCPRADLLIDLVDLVELLLRSEALCLQGFVLAVRRRELLVELDERVVGDGGPQEHVRYRLLRRDPALLPSRAVLPEHTGVPADLLDRPPHDLPRRRRRAQHEAAPTLRQRNLRHRQRRLPPLKVLLGKALDGAVRVEHDPIAHRVVAEAHDVACHPVERGSIQAVQFHARAIGEPIRITFASSVPDNLSLLHAAEGLLIFR
mmetsp:Transcript_32310/g.85421  ORF Transcript_32310/g.85421 Transcript_32310/m.85421 type:complete len:212 (-) Transcript_32310:93-728(-)